MKKPSQWNGKSIVQSESLGDIVCIVWKENKVDKVGK